MTIPNILTFTRIALSPVFFILFFLPEWMNVNPTVIITALWIVFIVSEVSDFLDGYLARKWDQVSDMGKVLDPFGDSISRLTYFLCFTLSGLMPAWIFIFILYRDLGVSFIRQLVAKKGISMSARFSGKLKAVLYSLSGIGGLIVLTLKNVALFQEYMIYIENTVFAIFLLSGIVAVWSLIDYASVVSFKE